ncbi:leucine-rich repeat domain-containing protein [Pseudomonas sp. HS6]|uniref:leucine-rich repeat domain-containing protein n=1 Tax=Pseudomonas sp. HS6 TaxID=2850559 RepID=UPI0020190729|nr:hypothetical protein [Pseudomonas sp. HS6]UQS12711.1 hypothetical protein JJN09_15895 [Pseudomonas sp. HS6]
MIGKPPKGSGPSSGKTAPRTPGYENPPRVGFELPGAPHRPALPPVATAPVNSGTEAGVSSSVVETGMIVSESASVVQATPPIFSALADFWISSAVALPAVDGQGFRIFKQRRYIQLTDGHLVQVVKDPATGDWRATLASELTPSGPVLLPDQHNRYWHPKDNSGAVQAPSTDDADVETFAPGSFSTPSTRLISQSSVELRVRALYPDLPDAEVTSFIGERLQVDPYSVLRRLEQESVTLREDLDRWLASASVTRPGHEPGTGAASRAAQQRSRETFSQDLQAIWRRDSVLTQGVADHSFSTFIDFSGGLPHLSARFEWVTELVLSARNVNVTLGRFLDGFPNVRFLILEAVRMDEFSPAIFQMRDLQHLTLNGCSLRLTESSAEGLSRIESLTLLDLNDNPLGIAPPVGFMHGLGELFLRDCGLADLPSGVERLPALTRVDLRGNDITTVGDELFEIADTQNLYLDLRGNPLGETARQRINRYLENSSLDRKVQIPMDEADVDDAPESSDSSDSGMESDIG